MLKKISNTKVKLTDDDKTDVSDWKRFYTKKALS